MKKIISIYPSIMTSIDKKEHSFSADMLESYDYEESLYKQLKKKYQKKANVNETVFLLEIRQNNGYLEYFEKIKKVVNYE